MTRAASWLLLVLFFGGFGALVYHILRGQWGTGKGMPAYSVYSTERNGLAAAAQFVRSLGFEPVALTRPVQQTRHTGLLVLVEPEVSALLPGQTPDLSEADVKGLLRWVERGNTLLLCGREITGLHRELSLTVARDERDTGARVTVSPDEAGAYTAGVDRLVVEGKDTVSSGTGLPLWWVGDEPGAVLAARGQGRVLVVPDPSLLTGRGLRRGDNAVFVANVVARHAQGGRVYFDEYHHGLRSGGGFWGYLRYHGQHGVLLALLIVAAVAGWAAAWRLGPAVPAATEARADAVDYASAVARIYQIAGCRHLLAGMLARDFQAALCRHLRLRKSALPAEVLASWRRQHGDEAAARLEQLLRTLGQLRQGRHVTDRQLLTTVATVDEFKHEAIRVK
jgi:hypothetical protein